jgi:hypothetical protein
MVRARKGAFIAYNLKLGVQYAIMLVHVMCMYGLYAYRHMAFACTFDLRMLSVSVECAKMLIAIAIFYISQIESATTEAVYDICVCEYVL